MADTIDRQVAIDALMSYEPTSTLAIANVIDKDVARAIIQDLPSAQPTLYGYNIEHLDLIARVLQKENLPPERVIEMLTDIGRIVAIVSDEFAESLRKAVEQCTMT